MNVCSSENHCIKIHFLNNKKIPAIPPLLVNGDIIRNFSEKTGLFTKFFKVQCTQLNHLKKKWKHFSDYDNFKDAKTDMRYSAKSKFA